MMIINVEDFFLIYLFSQPKCENYLPEKWGVFGEVEVVIDSIVPKRGHVLRHITLRVSTEPTGAFKYFLLTVSDLNAYYFAY